MKPREIRRYVLADHAFLRVMLEDLDRRAFRVLRGREDEVAALRDTGLSFHAKFAEHLAFEDLFLLPVLRDGGLGASENSKHMTEDHQEQRELLDYILAGLQDLGRSARVVADQMRSLVELVLDDMALEEMMLERSAVLGDPEARPSQSEGGSPSTETDRLVSSSGGSSGGTPGG